MSKTVREALDKISSAIVGGIGGGIKYPEISTDRDVELVLGFNNNEHIALKGPDKAPYFSSGGPLTDLHGNVVAGSRVATTFPVDPKSFGETEIWPHHQVEPFDQPPVDFQGLTNHGYSKQAYFFDNDANWFVTAGPALPKITRTKAGGALFWVGSIGVIAQGGGIYEGARGVATYVGSGYFDKWPKTFPEQVKLLRDGFKGSIMTQAKIVLR